MKIIVILAAVATAVSTQPATARGESVSIGYGDLNLASAIGSKTLEGRVKAAAHRVCGATQAPGLVELKSVTDCRARIFEAVKPQLEFARNDRTGGAVTISAAMLGAR